MFRAKIEISVNSESTRSERNVPTTAMPPIRSGSDAATTPAEDEEEQDREDGEGDQLGALEVLADRVVHVVEADGEAARPSASSSSD